MFKRFRKDKSGATMVEYALIVAVLSLTIIMGFNGVTNSLTYLWGNNQSRLNQAWSE